MDEKNEKIHVKAASCARGGCALHKHKNKLIASKTN